MAVDRPHILIRRQSRPLAFKSKTAGGNNGSRPPAIEDRAANALRIMSSLKQVVEAAQKIDTAELDTDRLPVTLKAGTDWGIGVKMPGRQNEILSVTGQGLAQRLNVAFDPETLEKVEKVSDKYAAYEGGNRPHYFNLFEAKPTIHLTQPIDLWASGEAIPKKGKSFLWEIWLAATHETRFRDTIDLLDLKAPRSVRLGSMRVVAIDATLAEMERLALSSTVAQLRPASSLTADAYSLPYDIQQSAVIAAARRLSIAGDHAPAVCLLDTGIAHDHPLLADSIDYMGSVSPSAGSDDYDGHGTKMAGLALFENLPDIIMNQGSADLTTKLESVAVMAPTGVTDVPNLAADRVNRAVNMVETIDADRPRTFCLAWNTPADGEDGAISSLSCEIDRLASQDAAQRLFCVAGGNLETASLDTDYQSLNDLTGMLSPAPAWNALVVGACTDLMDVPESHTALSPEGDLSPWSRTTVNWNEAYVAPSKPDVVCEGGNRQVDKASAALGNNSSLCLLTTASDTTEPLTLTGQTSAATAIVAGMCARLQAEYPAYWPETVRGLIAHSADYTPAMMDRARSHSHTKTGQSHALRRRYGAGRVNFAAARENAENSLTLVSQALLHPLSENNEGRVVLGEMRAHDLPWPTDTLAGLGETEVEIRVTLSYFIEPDPSAAVKGHLDPYPSHGFNFDVKRADETLDQAIARINAAHEATGKGSGESPDWLFGRTTRSRGSLKFDRLTIAAEDLAVMDAVLVYPSKGWWANDAQRVDQEARYSLIVSIHTPATDIYTEVANEIQIS